MIKNLLFALLFFALIQFTQAQTSQICKTFPSQFETISAENSRSDTIDILNYTLNLDITDITGKTISGNCAITFHPKINCSELNLDLLELSVDSVVSDTTLLNYSYNDTLLKITLPTLLTVNDTESVIVYYHGSPQKDASGWGGFYFQSGYAFNLGVGFDANPHNYGRVWFPCFDNFVERSTYLFNITTDSLYKAFCNGKILNETSNGNGTITWSWQMEASIPTYLASVAVGQYVSIHQTYNGIQDTVPIEIGAIASDTTKIKASFVNLNAALQSFEEHYGPYQWNRVGYIMVPFSSGAMEHATNIAYPKAFADGTTTYESLFAHELSHHWWGDLVTCQTAEDMWLNEGMAVFSEFLFSESVYGKEAYAELVNENHEYVIHYLHYTEDAYQAISGMSHEYTYSEHVYNKGADVAHTLRGYLGDSLFFNGLTAFLNTYQFNDITSYTLRDFLTNYTGIDLSSFFDNWVFSPGFPHFSIDSIFVQPNSSSYDVTVYLKQKLTGAPNYYSNVPLEISFMNVNWESYSETISMSGISDSFIINVPFEPIYVGIDLNDKISDAITAKTEKIINTGIYDFDIAQMDITVNSISDSAWVRVEHNWAYPDSLKNPSSQISKLSPNRYWKIDGIFPSVFDASAKIYFNGKNSTGGGYLDNDLITTTEDSLILVYRLNAASDWGEFPFYTVNTSGSHTDKYGYVTIDSLVKGEYALAIGSSLLGIKEKEKLKSNWLIYPNPSTNSFSIDVSEIENKNMSICVKDELGKNRFEQAITNTISHYDTKNWDDGNYYVELKRNHQTISTEKIIVINH